MLKENTILKGNLCIYKGFIDVLSVFDSFQETLGNAPDLRQRKGSIKWNLRTVSRNKKDCPL